MLPFPPIDGMKGIAKGWRISLFHFYKNEAAFLLGNDIYLSKSGPVVFFNNCVPFLFQGFLCPFFSFSSFFLFRQQGTPLHL
ncbi:MAG: hypothetical protein H6Q54_1968 [Deltaproteobacteria bacterium]|nr:hypothetical protein [Deltaproteobacteria bacterium]